MATSPNETLLQGSKGTPSDATPAKVGGSPNVTTFESQNVPPPSPLYIQRDDLLFVDLSSQVAGATYVITARLLLAGTNRIQTIQDQLVTPNAYQLAFKQLSLAEGYLLSLTVQGLVAGAAPFAFVTCGIARNAAANIPQQPGQILIQGFISTSAFASWPGGQYAMPSDGAGMPHSLTIGNPAAGADWIATVPTGVMWELCSFNATLTTSAAVANRQPQIVYRDGSGNAIFTGMSIGSIAASLGATVSGSQLSPVTSVIATDFPLPLAPRVLLTQGSTVRTVTANIQAADQWSAIQLFLREWFAM